MPEIGEIWSSALPKVLQGVTGRGVWTALNTAKPITVEDGVLIVGMPAGESELAGHLRIPSTTRLIETHFGALWGSPVRVRVIDGNTEQDYDVVKRRDSERRRMQEAEMAKMRTEMQARTSWDSVHEQLSRRWSAVPNKSLPQNRARFFEEATALVAEARKDMANYDDLSERNFARCIERIAQYCEIPSAMVGTLILQKAGEL